MNLSDLKFDYPEELIAKVPASKSRILLNDKSRICEIPKSDLLDMFQPGDVLVVNDTKVEKRRVFGKGVKQEFEILFIEKLNPNQWTVLFPASRLKKGETVQLPQNIEMSLVAQGIPQIVRLNQPLDEDYFENYGELPLPPYIQKARESRHNVQNDKNWYQTDWAQKPGSQAAPTASLHFKNSDFNFLKSKGVFVETVTLHVGLGTFLPLKTENLDNHVMHSEWCSLPKSVLSRIQMQKKSGSPIWALGTTVARTLESYAHGLLKESSEDFSGSTQLFIRDDFQFQIVDRLLTNFHQPETTLLALVASFAGLENVKKTYSYAIQNQFRLFSYGDLTVWVPNR